MKKLKSLFCALFAAAMVVGCSDQIDVDSQDKLKGEDGDGVYMGLDIQLPTGNLSRSETLTGGGSSGGTEVGLEIENVVSNALIILAEPGTHNFVAAGEVASNRLTASATQSSYKAVAKVSKTNLNNFYLNLTPGTTPIVEVFVFCNPTKWLMDKMSDYDPEEEGPNTWINYDAMVYQGNPNQADYNVGIWSANSFLMNNVKIVRRELPKNLLDWELFDKVENPFHLSENNTVKEGLPNNSFANERGPIKVERSVARFDFKDGSKDGDQKYNVLFQADPKDPENEAAKTPIVAVELQKMCLVNMSNRFYFLPRVSENGQNSGAGWTLCGNEEPWYRDEKGNYIRGNYVVGPYAVDFAKNYDIEDFYKYFNYPFFDENGSFNNGLETKNQWDVYNIKDVLNGTPDNYTGVNGNVQKGSYHIWRYVTENVIPGGETNQVNGISTGIVFRGRLTGTQDALDGKVDEETWEEDFYKNLALCLNGQKFQIRRKDHNPISGVDNDGYSDDPILYYLDGKIYFTWEHLRQAAIQASVTPTWDGDNIVSVEINRSNSLYRAVFGDGPIPAGMKYIKDGEMGQANARNFTDPTWSDNTESAAYKLYAQSCDYAWNEWVKAGEYVGTISGADPEKIKPLQLMRERMAGKNGAGITIYQSSLDPQSTPGYYCYYYYWNRHNDNNLAGVMGPMEFDVVRNNVYKLSVDKINRLGHPRIPENDPDNPTPTTPDESSNIYIDVTVEIADWAVRLNSIVF